MALAEPRARTLHDIASMKHVGRVANVKRPLPYEVLKRNFLDAAQRIPTPSSVVDDTTATGVNSMVSVSSATHDEPSAGHELSIHGLTRNDVFHRDHASECSEAARARLLHLQLC